MIYNQAFKDIMRSYAMERDLADSLFRKRQEEAYVKLPRLREIDRLLAQAGLGAAKSILADSGKVQKLLEDLRGQSAALQEEKKLLLAESGLPDGYFTDIYKCSFCQDTGYIEADRCKCLRQRLIDKYYDLSNIRRLLEVENFDNFDLRYYSTTKNQSAGISPRRNIELIYQSSLKFVEEFEINFQNLLFYGDTGLGKTFLCNCIAKDLLDLGYTVLYVTAPRIFKLVEDHRFNRNENQEPDHAIDAVTDADLLILDDLGAEFDTIVTSAALFSIINQRLLAKKPTVISTNLSPAEIESQYSARIVSRFLGNYKLSKFFGDDIRMKKKHKASKSGG